jgi:hypothetical protein
MEEWLILPDYIILMYWILVTVMFGIQFSLLQVVFNTSIKVKNTVSAVVFFVALFASAFEISVLYFTLEF